MKSLSKLDENSIVNISFGVSDLDYILPTKVALAAPVRTNFFDNNDTKSTILEFLTRYGVWPRTFQLTYVFDFVWVAPGYNAPRSIDH
jgi:hypothetical protein